MFAYMFYTIKRFLPEAKLFVHLPLQLCEQAFLPYPYSLEDPMLATFALPQRWPPAEGDQSPRAAGTSSKPWLYINKKTQSKYNQCTRRIIIKGDLGSSSTRSTKLLEKQIASLGHFYFFFSLFLFVILLFICLLLISYLTQHEWSANSFQFRSKKKKGKKACLLPIYIR